MPHQHQHEDNSPLDRYGRDLTALARQGAFAALAGHDARVARVFAILLRNRSETSSSRTRCNPVILDLDGTQSWPLAGEVIRRMAFGEAPEALCDCRVVALDWEALLADAPNCEGILQTSSRPEAHLPYQRLAALFSTIRCSEEHIILFVEQLHRLLGGEWDRNPVDACNLLVPALHRGEMQILATCPLDPYRRYIERDASIEPCMIYVCMPDALAHLGTSR